MTRVLEVLAAVIVAVGAWQAGVHLFPWKTCPRCDGARRIKGGSRVHRDCGRCGSTGRVRRIGAGRESLWDRTGAPGA